MQLQDRYEPGEAQSITRIVLEDAFKYSPERKVLPVSPEEELLYRHIRYRLLRGEPVQYVLGVADFYGLQFMVDQRVLIPRQETEELVHWVLEDWKKAGKPADKQLLDIGTGSGCIPITIKHQAPPIDVSGLDVDAGALELAALNAERYETPIRWIHQDILKTEEWERLGQFDYIVSNPPYIPPSERHLMPEHVLSHEPELALFAPENDPLVFYREIGLFAFQQLLPDCALYFETNEYNADRVADLLRDIGFSQVDLRQDLAGKDRMVRGRR